MLSENLKKFREKKGISQQKLADETGVTQQFIYYLERGFKNPSIDMLKRLASILECTSDDLIR